MALTFHFTDFPKIIGHRGLSAFAPENTLAAFELAFQKGIAWVECDVRLSQDKIPMVFHDATLERTSNGTGSFQALTFRALKKLDAGSWFSEDFVGQQIPSLDELLDLAVKYNCGVNIEIKPNLNEEIQTVEQINHLLQQRPNNPALLFSSFSIECIKQCQTLMPLSPRALVIDELDSLSAADIVALSEALGCTSLHLDHHLLYTDIVAHCYYAPFDILCYTVNNPATAKQCWQAGAASVFSDNGLLDQT